MKECQAKGQVGASCRGSETCVLSAALKLELEGERPVLEKERDLEVFTRFVRRQTGCTRHNEVLQKLEMDLLKLQLEHPQIAPSGCFSIAPSFYHKKRG